MLNIILACMAGMSTNVMRGKIEEAGKEKQVDLTVKAISMDDIDKYLDTCDVVLLGPQIRYAENEIRKTIDKRNPNVKLMCIDTVDFGMMRGDLVFQKLMKLLNE